MELFVLNVAQEVIQQQELLNVQHVLRVNISLLRVNPLVQLALKDIIVMVHLKQFVPLEHIAIPQLAQIVQRVPLKNINLPPVVRKHAL